jgi:hypothetical protein
MSVRCRPLPAAGTAITGFLCFPHAERLPKMLRPVWSLSKLTCLSMRFFRSLNKLLAEPHCRSGSFDSGTAEPS